MYVPCNHEKTLRNILPSQSRNHSLKNKTFQISSVSVRVQTSMINLHDEIFNCHHLEIGRLNVKLKRNEAKDHRHWLRTLPWP